MEEITQGKLLRKQLEEYMDFSETLLSRIEQLKSYIIRSGFEIPSQDAGLHAPIVELKDFEDARSIKRRRVGNTNYEQPSTSRNGDHSDYSAGPSNRSDGTNTFSLNQVLNSQHERSRQDDSQYKDQPAGPFMNNTYSRNFPKGSSNPQSFPNGGFPLDVPSNGENFSDLTGLRFSESPQPQPQPQAQQMRLQSRNSSRPQSRSQSANNSLMQPQSQFLSRSHIDSTEPEQYSYESQDRSEIESDLQGNSNGRSLDIVEEAEEEEEEEEDEEEPVQDGSASHIDHHTSESYEEISQGEANLDMSEYQAQLHEEEEMDQLEDYQNKHSSDQSAYHPHSETAASNRSIRQDQNNRSRYDTEDIYEQEELQLEPENRVREQRSLQNERSLRAREEEELRQRSGESHQAHVHENRQLSQNETYNDSNQRARKVTPNGNSTPSRSLNNSYTDNHGDGLWASGDNESSITHATTEYANIAPAPRITDRHTSTPSKIRPASHYNNDEPSELEHGDTRNSTHHTPIRIQQSPAQSRERIATQSPRTPGDVSESNQSINQTNQSSKLRQMFTSKMNSSSDRSLQRASDLSNVNSQSNASQGNASQGNASQGNASQGNASQGNASQGNVSQGNSSQDSTIQGPMGQRTERRGRKPGKSSRYSMSHINKIMNGEIKPGGGSSDIGNQTAPAISSERYSLSPGRVADATDPGTYNPSNVASQDRQPQQREDTNANQTADSSAQFYSAIGSFADKPRSQVSASPSELDVRFSLTSPNATGSSSVSTIKGINASRLDNSLRGADGIRPHSANNSTASISRASKPALNTPEHERSSVNNQSANNSRGSIIGNSSTDSLTRGYRKVSGLPGSWPTNNPVSPSTRHDDTSQLIPPVVQPSEAKNNVNLPRRKKLQRKVYEVSNIDATIPDISDVSVRSEDIQPLPRRPRLD